MDILKDDQVLIPGLRFKCTRGSRFGVHQNNSIAVILYHEKIVECLQEAQKDQTKWQEKRLERSLIDNTAKWEINRLFIGSFAMIWIGIGRRLLSVENANLTVTEKKKIANKSIERFTEIIQGDNKFEILRRFCITATTEQYETDAINQIENWMASASDEMNVWINRYLLEASEKCLWKINKDTEYLVGLPDSNEKIQTSNRYYLVFKHYLNIFKAGRRSFCKMEEVRSPLHNDD